MQHEALLPTVAEIGATIAGFSGVVALFRRGTTPAESDPEVFIVRDVVQISLMVAAFALLPFLPEGLHLDESEMWRVCSLLLALSILVSMITSLREVKRVHGVRPIRQNPVPPWLLLPLVVAMQLSLWVNVFDMWPSSAGTLYLAALFLLLVLAGLFFLSLLIPARR
jgi:hypothetical protein